jgi:hypothetical protein
MRGLAGQSRHKRWSSAAALRYGHNMGIVRKVIDSNHLRSPALKRYLAQSRANVAVLTEFVLLEAHKQDPLVTLPKSIEILAQHAAQVALLRTSENLLGFRGRSAGLQRRLIDERRSAEFPRFCRQARAAVAGDAPSRAAILNTAHIARAHIDSLVAAAPTVIDLFEHHARRFEPDEVRAIRTGTPYAPATQLKLIDIVFESATDVARATGAIRTAVQPAEIVNLPVFRYCLCMMILLTRWIVGGRQKGSNPASIANDVIDANIAAYATYFDGVLTADRKLIALHREARHILIEIGGTVPR